MKTYREYVERFKQKQTPASMVCWLILAVVLLVRTGFPAPWPEPPVRPIVPMPTPHMVPPWTNEIRGVETALRGTRPPSVDHPQTTRPVRPLPRTTQKPGTKLVEPWTNEIRGIGEAIRGKREP